MSKPKIFLVAMALMGIVIITLSALLPLLFIDPLREAFNEAKPASTIVLAIYFCSAFIYFDRVFVQGWIVRWIESKINK